MTNFPKIKPLKRVPIWVVDNFFKETLHRLYLNLMGVDVFHTEVTIYLRKAF